MEFLYPNMLYALFALLIPVVIHLFNFRRHKTVYFSNTSVLKTIEQENSKTKKLKYLIAMMMRMLFIAALVMAFAFPYKKNTDTINNNADNLIAVYIDNSMSMQSLSTEKKLFDDARSSALTLIDELNQAAKFVLLSNDRDPLNEYPMNKDEMIIRLNEMKAETAPCQFADIYNNLSFIKSRNNFKTATLFAYSDFQRNMMEMDDIKIDTTIQVVAVPLKSEFQNNIYIDTAWLQSPILQKNMTNEINARIVNETSNEVKGLPVNFSIDENSVAYTTADIPANSFALINMQFAVEDDGFKKAKVSIKDSPITFDDEYNLVLKIKPQINVVEIAKSQKPKANSLELLFSDDALVNYVTMNPNNVEQNIINEAQMIVLNANVNETLQQSLLDFASQGGSLLIFNDENTDNSYLYEKLGLKKSYLDENKTKIEFIANKNSFFDDIFLKLPDNAELPEIHKHFRFEILRNSNALSIMSLQNANPFLIMSQHGKGKVFVSTISLDEEWSDLTSHALFVPLMYKMALVGGGVTDLSYTLGLDKYVNINNLQMMLDDRISLKSENGMYEIFPMIENRNNINYMYFFEDLPSSGFYDVLKNENFVSTLAWNDNRKESEMKFFEKEELSDLMKNKEMNLLAAIDYEELSSGDVMKAVIGDRQLWKSFIILALTFLLIEILVLRFFK